MTATYLACLTPPGAGAIATLALRGPAAWTIACELAPALSSHALSTWKSGKFWLARLGEQARNEADEVVVALKQIDPEPWVELHCHGGREVVRWLEALLAARGVKIVSWQQFARTASADPLRDATLPVVAAALTTRTAAIALDQYHGAFSRAIEQVQKSLKQSDTAAADRQLTELLQWSAVGRHLTAPWRVVIAGAANTGKSSLVNALAGYQRSVVSSTPGTTRDVVTTLLALEGWPVEVADTAGWRPTTTGLESEGISRARQAMASADLCVWLLDASTAPVWPSANLGAVHFVINKMDLAPAWQLDSVEAVRVSAQSGAGLPDLCQAIAKWLVPQSPPAGVGVPFTINLADALGDLQGLVQSGRNQEALGNLDKLREACD